MQGKLSSSVSIPIWFWHVDRTRKTIRREKKVFRFPFPSLSTIGPTMIYTPPMPRFHTHVRVRLSHTQQQQTAELGSISKFYRKPSGADTDGCRYRSGIHTLDILNDRNSDLYIQWTKNNSGVASCCNSINKSQISDILNENYTQMCCRVFFVVRAAWQDCSRASVFNCSNSGSPQEAIIRSKTALLSRLREQPRYARADAG